MAIMTTTSPTDSDGFILLDRIGRQPQWAAGGLKLRRRQAWRLNQLSISWRAWSLVYP